MPALHPALTLVPRNYGVSRAWLCSTFAPLKTAPASTLRKLPRNPSPSNFLLTCVGLLHLSAKWHGGIDRRQDPRWVFRRQPGKGCRRVGDEMWLRRPDKETAGRSIGGSAEKHKSTDRDLLEACVTLKVGKLVGRSSSCRGPNRIPTTTPELPAHQPQQGHHINITINYYADRCGSKRHFEEALPVVKD